MTRALLAAALVLAGCDAEIPVTQAGAQRQSLAPTNLPAFFDCLRTTGAVVVSAHRGGPSSGHAENTVSALANTLTSAPVFIEVDVGVTQDGALFLMHDETVDRTTTGSGRLNELTRDQVRSLTVEDTDGTPLNHAPTELAEALAWANGRTVLELDIKRGVAYEDVITEVEAAGAMGRVVFITYSIDGASRIARLAPEAMIYTTISSARELDLLERRGVDLSRVVAWVGTDAPPASLVAALNARGVETRFGMFGEGRDYENAARARAQIVAVDDAAEAVRDLDAADGEEGYAALQCLSAD